MESHGWPGNVRELESLILRQFLMQDELSEELDVTPAFSSRAPDDDSSPRKPADFRSSKARALAEFERSYLEHLLRCAGGNLSLAWGPDSKRLAGASPDTTVQIYKIAD